KDCIKLFFALCNAMLDVSIAVWECKRRYDSVRPITAIHELYRGRIIKAWGGPFKGTVEMDGKDWMPYQLSNFVTPPFPEHVSGHSTFSRAAATILQSYTHKDIFEGCFLVKKGSSRIEPGKTPSVDIMLDWPTFTAAAEEAGVSRLYGGIHFKRGNDLGQKLGAAVGKCVWEKAVYYYND
ncbi:MAG TPA: vanadium-dependent haloperoxidase, partial [Chitinophagaceae bacterium]|nr:vanadium-dependent haloperoxidase [Chitinophagaceae bacterium]